MILLKKASNQGHKLATEYLDEKNLSFGIGWTWNMWPWSFSKEDNAWLYYNISGGIWMVWRQKNNSWYSWDNQSKFWKLL